MLEPNNEILDCDVLVVGGGINGAGIARDAAGRGLSVILCEKDDLAAHTSSCSTKLIHGGLRYLEHYEFRLVRKALQEREVLMRSAPHLIRPLRFVMPHDSSQRPKWMIRAGLFLYDHLARRELLPGSGTINLRSHTAGMPLKSEFSSGFVYSDGWVDDARLVVLNALDAANRGARIFTRTRFESARKNSSGCWMATLRKRDNAPFQVRARCLVNAAGPWVGSLLLGIDGSDSKEAIRLDKGSHIIVRKLFDHPYAYIFQHQDGRIVFAIPYEGEFTLIGTTDLEFHGDPDQVKIETSEVEYLCELCNHYFRKSISPTDVIWSYSGVRPLVEDAAANPAAVTRDYHFELDRDGAPLLSVFGGKITTFRKLAEEALDLLSPLLACPHPAWTANAFLAGGDFSGDVPNNRGVLEFESFASSICESYPWLPANLIRRYFHRYGSRINLMLEGCQSIADLGAELLPGLYEHEARYWMRREWALTAEDMLWRRSKLGLHVPAGSAEKLDEWIARQTL